MKIVPFDELTNGELRRIIEIAREIKRSQEGTMIVCPSVGDGRGLYIVGPLVTKERRKKAA